MVYCKVKLDFLAINNKLWAWKIAQLPLMFYFWYFYVTTGRNTTGYFLSANCMISSWWHKISKNIAKFQVWNLPHKYAISSLWKKSGHLLLVGEGGCTQKSVHGRSWYIIVVSFDWLKGVVYWLGLFLHSRGSLSVCVHIENLFDGDLLKNSDLKNWVDCLLNFIHQCISIFFLAGLSKISMVTFVLFTC